MPIIDAVKPATPSATIGASTMRSVVDIDREIAAELATQERLDNILKEIKRVVTLEEIGAESVRMSEIFQMSDTKSSSYLSSNGTERSKAQGKVLELCRIYRQQVERDEARGRVEKLRAEREALVEVAAVRLARMLLDDQHAHGVGGIGESFLISALGDFPYNPSVYPRVSKDDQFVRIFVFRALRHIAQCVKDRDIPSSVTTNIAGEWQDARPLDWLLSHPSRSQDVRERANRSRSMMVNLENTLNKAIADEYASVYSTVRAWLLKQCGKSDAPLPKTFTTSIGVPVV